jgi:hypothetical protein
VFAILILASTVSSYLAVAAAIVFTFILPGLIGYRFFNLSSHERWAFVPVFSVLISVQLIYYLSLLVGYSRWSILLAFAILTALYTVVVYKKGEPITPRNLLKIGKINKSNIMLFAVIFLVSLSVLAVSVWRGNQYGIVLTGSNWQDTPLHYDVIESLNNGNFPPQMPHFIGEKLTYHYFVDFHTAIIEKVYGYLPTLLPVLNAVFILVFALSIYALARIYSRKVAILATVLGVFGWGLSYFGLFSALINGQFNPNQNYIYQYGGTFGLPSVFDNLLQQRPLLIGLPAFAFVLALLRKMDDKKRILLAGIITGLVFQFHNVAFFCCYIAFTVYVLFNFKRFNLGFLYFLVPSVLVLPFILVGGPPISVTVSNSWIANFAQNPFSYYFLNLGVPFLLAIASFFWRGHKELKATLFFLVLIPNVLLLTPNPWDMYKFFIFAWVPIAVLSGIILARVWVPKWRIVALALVLLSVMTSASVIIYNVGTDYPGASWSEYQVGMWVRANTPQNSVFLTFYGLHTPTSMIGGRLQVSSYVYWSYGHGIPLNEINSRAQQIDSAYTGDVLQLATVVYQYNISYVYVGNEEFDHYPNCTAHFSRVNWLTQVYSQNNLYIYKVDTAKMATSVPLS